MSEQNKALFLKISIYYFVLIASVVLLAFNFPRIMAILPIGGAAEMMNSSPQFSSLQAEISSTYRAINDFQGAIQLSMELIGTILVMLPIRWVYYSSSFGSHRQGIAANLILLPLIVTGIVAIVQNSLALAFSLAGIVAGVSYRTRLKDSTDALFIFFAIGVGLAAGTRSLGIAMVMSLFFSYSVIILPPRTEGSPADDEEKKAKSMSQKETL